MGKNLHYLSLAVNHGWVPAVIGERRVDSPTHATFVGCGELPDNPIVELFEGNGRWFCRFKVQVVNNFAFPIHHAFPLNQPRKLNNASNTDEVSIKLSNK